ncbi:sensor histidine kinase [Romboutsia maritimum]|uniref:histidine kinase n=1 Tax=Romboutsia maritimum TaxID=2020948 RepID=A0A371IWH6_9FIRM|nr:HAMP domain-containing sensor histidine kinase [Romboutsia maritimum]RDY24818.1 sensor histidine kinase [Romboutsia maritimum]
MGDLYKYREIIETLNIIIIISIQIMCMYLYKVSRKKSFLKLTIMSLVELCIYILCINIGCIYIYTQNVKYLISLMYIVKSILLILFSKEIKFKIEINIFLIVGNLLAILVLNTSYEISMLINIMLNSTIINRGIIDKIEEFSTSLSKNKHKLKINKHYISKSKEEIALECRLQQKFKNGILDINNKISKSIEESNTPIFILNFKKELICINKVFKIFLEEDKIDIEKFEVEEFFKEKFINSQEMLHAIENIDSKNNCILSIKSFKNQIYRFICSRDMINGQSMIICILNDITQSTMIQNQLKESEERYRKLMDILSDGVIIHNMNTISYINSKAIDIFNICNQSEKVLLIDDIKKQITKKFRQEFISNINLVQLGKKDKTITKIETENGKIIEFMTMTLTLNNAHMMLSLAIDITTLEIAKNELEESEKTYKVLLQALPEGMVVIDKKTKNHTYMNKAMIKLLKKIGVDSLNEIVKKYVASREFGKFKKFSVGTNGNIDISVAIIDRKEEENFLVVARLLEDKYNAKKMAEKLSVMEEKNKFKTEFLSLIARDLKKPINTIFNVNNILDNDKEIYNSKYVNNYTRLVKQNSYRLKRLLNNIDEIMSIENEKYDMNFKKYDIVSLVEDIVNLSKVYTEEKGLEILFSSNVKTKILIIDKDKIEKIILNLLSNAIKFTDSGGKIYVYIDAKEEKVCVCVQDTGVGIPEDKKDFIFEKFEQLDRTLSRGAEGTGVGLSLVKKLAELNDAKIKVSSKLGEGSKFELVFKNNVASNLIALNTNSEITSIDREKVDIEFSDIYFNIES